jgi:hypothetical protein
LGLILIKAIKKLQTIATIATGIMRGRKTKYELKPTKLMKPELIDSIMEQL